MSDDKSGSGQSGQPGAAGAGAGAGAAAGGGQQAPPWFAMDGMAADQVTALGDVIKTKGWKHPGEALQSYVNLEKLFGADKAGRTILAPKSDDDADGWNALYQRLGRPEKPDGYKLPVPEGQSDEFAKAAAPVLHSLGLSQKQAEKLAGWWNEFQATTVQQQGEAFAAKTAADYTALKNEWGQASTQNEELARRAVAKFGQSAGLDGPGLERLEKAIGTGPMLKLFHAIGASFAEGTFVAGDSATGGKLTPSQAQNKINAKFADQEFMARYMHPDEKVRGSAIDEMMALQRAAHPELAE